MDPIRATASRSSAADQPVPPGGLVVIPTFDERPEVLSRTVQAVRDAGYPVLIIDDGSVPAVRSDELPAGCLLIRHRFNLGQGAALQTGFAFATRRNYDWLVTFDADGQHRVADIPRLLVPLLADEADLVFGSRFLHPDSRAAIPGLRRTVLRAGRIFNGWATGLWMTDAHCGLRAVHRRAFRGIALRENRMAYATELLWTVRRAGWRWCEVPIHADYSPYSRAKGQSSWNALGIAWNILLRRFYP